MKTPGLQTKLPSGSDGASDEAEAAAAAAEGASASAPAGGDHYRLLLDRLFSMLSHDLRTPLSAISGWLFLLESDKLDAPGRKRALEKIRSNLDEEVRVIDDTLALARVHAGTLQLEHEDLDVDAVTRRAVEKMMKPAGVKNVALRHEADAAAPPTIVSGDAARLGRAIELVIDRALRESHGAEARIDVKSGGACPTAASETGAARIVIEDNGRGIAADALRWIIDPFGSPADPETGSRHAPDRCLLIAAALIDAHGGRLTVNSAGDGAGATYTITLPV